MLRKTISLLLCIAFLSSILTIIPNTVSAKENEDINNSMISNDSSAQESYTFDVSSLFQLEDDSAFEEDKEIQPATEETENDAAEEPISEIFATKKENIDIASVAANPEISSGDFTYEILDEKVYITAYVGSETEITFPSLIDGKPVYGIEPNGKANCIPNNTVTKLVIAEGICTIGDNAFRSRTALKTVQLNNQLTTIGNESFRDCTALTEIIFPESLKQLSFRSFSNCGFIELEVPGTIEDLGIGAFLGCQQLKKAVIGEGVEEIYSPFAECHALEEVILPSTLKRMVHDGTFNTCYSLTHIELPDGLEEICDYAFDRATSLKSIIIPDSVKTIGKGVFSGCSSLESVKLSKNITSVPEYSFSGCESLKEQQIFDKVTEIGDGAFQNCTGLASVSLPDGLTAIGKNAFADCTSLESVTIPENVTRLDYGVFYNCTSLKDVYANDNISFIGRFVRNYFQTEAGAFQKLSNGNNLLANEDVVIHCGKYSITAREILNRVSPVDFVQLDFSSVERPEETTILDTENSAYTVYSGTAMNFVCNYRFKDEIYNNVSEKKLLLHMPVGMDLVNNYIYVDGNNITNYSFDTYNRNYIIPVNNQSGKVHLIASVEESDYDLRSYAALSCVMDGRTVTETIDMCNENIEMLTITTSGTTSNGQLTVTGTGPKSREVQIYIDSKLYTTVITNKVGAYTTDISIPDPVNTMTYCIEARIENDDGEIVSAAAYTQYVKSAPTLKGFWMMTKSRDSSWSYDLLNPDCKIRLWPGVAVDYRFVLDFESADEIEEIKLTSTKDGKTASYRVYRNEKTHMFQTDTILLDYKTGGEYEQGPWLGAAVPSYIAYLPGRLSIEIKTKPIQPDVTLNWANSIVQSIVDYTYDKPVNSYRIVNKTNNSTEIIIDDIEENGGYIDTTVFNGAPAEFLTNYPDIAGYTYDGTINGGLTDFTDTALTGTEAKQNPDIENIGKEITPDQIINYVKHKWEPTPSPNGTLYTNMILNEGSAKLCIFDAAAETFTVMDIVTNAFSYLSGVFTQNNPCAKYAGIAGILIAGGASFYSNNNEYKSMMDLFDAREREIRLTIKDSAQLKKSLQYLQKCRELFGWGCILNVIGSVVISAGVTILGATSTPVVMIVGAVVLCLGVALSVISTMLKNGVDVWGDFLHWVYSRNPFIWVIDPSGYIYAGLISNRISDATVSAYGIIFDGDIDNESFWDSPDESRAELWNAVEYSQYNPLFSDKMGNYSWDVPEGWWKVVVEKDGYETYTTDWLPVPPPQMDVNINLVSTQKPSLERWEQTDKGILLSFVDPITPDSLNITLTNPDGSLSPGIIHYDEEKSLDDETLVKNCILELPSDHQDGKYLLTINSAKTYAGVVGDITQSIVIGKGILGDVDGDGEVTIIDATYIQRKLASIPIPFEFDDNAADTDGDSSVTIIDATYIQRWLASLTSNDNIGKPIK